MKDLIFIGAHCPDDEREQLLINLVNELQSVRENYDIIICSHTNVPEYVLKKVDYFFLDKNNELITDTKYLNQPWFSPFDGLTILSTLIGENSTYLAVYRLLISGLGISKVFGYKKTHYIEYDTDFKDLTELDLHSKLLDDYDWVAIQKKEKLYEDNLSWPMGNFYSFKVNSLDEIFTKYNKELLLKLLENSNSKTNEKITNDIMRKNGKKVHVRDFDNEISKKNTYGLSKHTSKDSLNFWAVPFYDKKKDILSLVVWNNKNETPIDVTFIINDDKIFYFPKVEKFSWSIREVGKIEEVKKITTLIDGKVKNNILFDDSYRNIFKTTNYAYYA